jgi:uncharacterized protein (TIGR02147 family)
MRHERNSNYSIRAFSRDLNVSISSLSEILSGKRNISYNICQKIFNKINWPATVRIEFMYSAAKKAKKQGLQRTHPEFKRILTHKDSVLFEAEKIDQEIFISISEWYHIAILEMTFTENLKITSTKVIANRLGVPNSLIRKAVLRLLELGFLEDDNGVLRKTHKSLSIANTDKTNECLIKHQEKILKKATEKLRTDPIELRNNSSMSMAIDPDKIPLAKKEIRLFLHKMSQILECGKQKKVYQLNVNLFSLES